MKILAELRKAKGLTQQQTSDSLGIARPTYSRYETGEREPDLETLKKLAAFYEVSTDCLLGVENNQCHAYSIEHSEFMIETYFRGITLWSENKFFTLHEMKGLKEHFAELLLKYKLLVSAAADLKISYPTYEEAYQQYNQTLEKPLTTREIKEQYFKQNLERHIDEVAHWISTLPRYLSTDK